VSTADCQPREKEWGLGQGSRKKGRWGGGIESYRLQQPNPRLVLGDGHQHGKRENWEMKNSRRGERRRQTQETSFIALVLSRGRAKKVRGAIEGVF